RNYPDVGWMLRVGIAFVVLAVNRARDHANIALMFRFGLCILRRCRIAGFFVRRCRGSRWRLLRWSVRERRFHRRLARRSFSARPAWTGGRSRWGWRSSLGAHRSANGFFPLLFLFLLSQIFWIRVAVERNRFSIG